MNGKFSTFDPCRFGGLKECETFASTALHLHHMSDDVNGAWIPWIECECATRYPFGTTILSILLKTECVHRKDTCVARQCGFPHLQHLGDAISQHSPLTEAKVECMSDRKRENVARPVDHDCAVTFKRKIRSVLKPSSRRGRVTMRVIVPVRACHLDRRNAGCGFRPCGPVIGAHDDCSTQTVGEYIRGIVGEGTLHLDQGIAAMPK